MGRARRAGGGPGRKGVEAVIVAMGILMWMWGAACLRLVLRLPPATGTTRSAWLALALAIGAGLLVALAQLVLPSSVLSQGWSRETLQAAQLWTLAVVLGTAVLGWWRGHRQLSPPLRKPAAVVPAGGAAARKPARAPGKTSAR